MAELCFRDRRQRRTGYDRKRASKRRMPMRHRGPNGLRPFGNDERSWPTRWRTRWRSARLGHSDSSKPLVSHVFDSGGNAQAPKERGISGYPHRRSGRSGRRSCHWECQIVGNSIGKATKMKKAKRFVVNENGNVIDTLDLSKRPSIFYAPGDPEDDIHLRERVLWSRLSDLVDNLLPSLPRCRRSGA